MALHKPFPAAVPEHCAGNRVGRLVCDFDLVAPCHVDRHVDAFRDAGTLFHSVGGGGAAGIVPNGQTLFSIAGDRVCRTCGNLGYAGMGAFVVFMGISLGAAGVKSMGATCCASDSSVDGGVRSVLFVGLV